MDKNKIEGLLLNYKNAIVRLEEVVTLEQNEITRDAAIQRFEFSFELAWKLMQAILIYQGLTVNSPREAIRLSAEAGLLNNPEDWLGFLEARNLSAQTYNEDIAKEVYEKAKEFLSSAKLLSEKANQQ